MSRFRLSFCRCSSSTSRGSLIIHWQPAWFCPKPTLPKPKFSLSSIFNIRMKKWVKIVGWCLWGIVGLILIGYAVIVSYKKEIIVEINELISCSINRQMQICDLSITLLHDFPNIPLPGRNGYLRIPRYDQLMLLTGQNVGTDSKIGWAYFFGLHREGRVRLKLNLIRLVSKKRSKE